MSVILRIKPASGRRVAWNVAEALPQFKEWNFKSGQFPERGSHKARFQQRPMPLAAKSVRRRNVFLPASF